VSPDADQGPPRQERPVRPSIFLFQSLTYTYPGVSADALALIFRAYLAEQPIEHLSGTLRRGGVRDLFAFFPASKRDSKALDAHFKAAGIPTVAEWWVKKQTAVAKEAIIGALKEAGESDSSLEEVSLPPDRALGRTNRSADGRGRQGTAGGAETLRAGARAVHLAGPHGYRRLVCAA
jgi:hypothetical protein